MFINDRYPLATAAGRPQTERDSTVVPTLVKHGASIGSGAIILCGITIGERAMVGPRRSRDVPDHGIVLGVRARLTGDVRERETTQ